MTAFARTSGRAGARARNAPRRAAHDSSRIEWTTKAKAVRLALTTYQAQLRKLGERQRETRDAARRVPAEDLAVIVARVAEDTGADPTLLAQAVGLQTEPKQPQA